MHLLDYKRARAGKHNLLLAVNVFDLASFNDVLLLDTLQGVRLELVLLRANLKV